MAAATRPRSPEVRRQICAAASRRCTSPGKTTLLKIIAGLLAPTAGEVRVDGRPVTGPGPERAFVFQNFALLPWTSVLRNAAFGLEMQGVPKPAREERARHYIREVGLAGFEDRYPPGGIGPGGWGNHQVS